MSEPWLPADYGSDRGGIQQRVARGLTWTLIDTWGSQLLGLVIFLVLVKLLAVEDIGLVALAAAFVALVQLFVDQGLGDALIQRPTLTRGQIDTAFWTAVATGSLLTLGGILAAGPLAWLLGEPRLEPILQALSFTFLLTAFSSTQMALLRREMAFRSLAIRRLVALACGGAIGIALAYLGNGAGALVAQQLAMAVISVLTLWTVSPWRPGLQVSWADFRTLFAYGINIVAGDLLFFISQNVDALLIGTFLGPTQLGFYSVGYRFLHTSTALLVNAARKLVFPVFSRLQNHAQRVRNAYARMSRAIAVVILPGYIGLSLVAQEVVVVLVGQRWAESSGVASILFLIGPVLALQAFSGSLLNAVGHPEVTLRFRFVTTVTNVAGFLIAVLAFRDILAVAAAYVLRGYLLVPLILWWMRVYAGIPIGENIRRLATIGVATALMAVAVIGVKLLLGPAVSTLFLLVAEILVGIVVYTAALLLLERGLVRETWNVALQALPGRDLARQAFTGRRESARSADTGPTNVAGEIDDL